jgi:hypothetical protein
MLNSWVERRAAKERYLRNAADVWRRAQAAIAEACDRLREHYSEVASVRRINKNDDTVVITIARSRRSALVEYETVDVISIQFKPDAAGIAVKRGRSATLEFPIGADADDAFITGMIASFCSMNFRAWRSSKRSAVPKGHGIGPNENFRNCCKWRRKMLNPEMSRFPRGWRLSPTADKAVDAHSCSPFVTPAFTGIQIRWLS